MVCESNPKYFVMKGCLGAKLFANTIEKGTTSKKTKAKRGLFVTLNRIHSNDLRL